MSEVTDRYKWVHTKSFGLIVKDIHVPIVPQQVMPGGPYKGMPLSSFEFTAIDYGYGSGTMQMFPPLSPREMLPNKPFIPAKYSMRPVDDELWVGHYPYLRVHLKHKHAAEALVKIMKAGVVVQKEVLAIVKLTYHE